MHWPHGYFPHITKQDLIFRNRLRKEAVVNNQGSGLQSANPFDLARCGKT